MDSNTSIKKLTTLKITGRLLSFLRPYKFLVVLAIILLFFSTGLALATPALTKTAIDNFILGKNIALLPKVAMLLLVISLAESVLSSLLRILTEYISQNTVHQLRKTLYEHINNLSIGFFDWTKTGDLMSRITADSHAVGQLYGFGAVNILVNFLTLIGIFIVVTIWEPRLGLLYLALIPFVVIAMRAYAFKVRPLWRKNRQANGEITSIMQETITSMRIIKLFGTEKEELLRFSAKNREVCDLLISSSKVSSYWQPYIGFLTSTASALVLLIGGSLVIKEQLTLGTLIAFTSYLGLLARPIRQSGFLIGMIQSSAAAGERIFEILDTTSNVKEKEGALDVPDVAGKLTFENVSFAYPNSAMIVKDISLEILPRERVALVGPTGAGKSTLISLIPRFYDPTSGRILLDGVDIKEYKLKSLRAKIGFVLQETFLFDGSIRDNIAYGKPDASLDEIREAAKAAEIDDFIMTLPQSYDSPIGERGVRLSGGQKQRIAIARVILVNPPILILDEPTANIDAGTEAKMEKALLNVTNSRTTIVIAHRLWAIQNAGRIAVLEKGQLTQVGTHTELLALGGFYKEAYLEQSLQAKEVAQ